MQPDEPTPTAKIEFNPKASLTDEERLRIIAEVSADAIYDWDIEAGLTRWNHGMRTLFGYAGDTVQTHQWWQERVHPDDKERVVKSVRSALEQKVDYWTEEYRYRRADGSVAHVIDRGYLIYDKDRNPLRMIGATVDITSRVNLAEAEIKSAIEDETRCRPDLSDINIIVNSVIMPPIVLAANEPVHKRTVTARRAVNAKSRCNINEIASSLGSSHTLISL